VIRGGSLTLTVNHLLFSLDPAIRPSHHHLQHTSKYFITTYSEYYYFFVREGALVNIRSLNSNVDEKSAHHRVMRATPNAARVYYSLASEAQQYFTVAATAASHHAITDSPVINKKCQSCQDRKVVFLSNNNFLWICIILYYFIIIIYNNIQYLLFLQLLHKTECSQQNLLGSEVVCQP
jgi:hypothetical protein